MSSDLYLKDTYLNKSYPMIINKVIIEYDLKSANTSLCKEYNLLPDAKIQEIENMPKKNRVKTIGKIMRKDEKFKTGLKDAFIDIRRRFFEENNIQDEDVLAIKKDAIFCLREIKHTEFGFCKFSSKNRYTSYLYVNQLEIYYNSKGNTLGDNGKIDVKGISDVNLEKHADYMLKFFKILFRHLEISPRKTLNRYIANFIDRYKNLQLEVGYYREFNQMSIIRLNDSDETYDNDIFIPYENKHEHLLIDYNFFEILLPIVKLIL
jgi:hypothetical protein